MLQGISWSNYLLTVTTVIIAYYGFLWFKYHGKKIGVQLSNKIQPVEKFDFYNQAEMDEAKIATVTSEEEFYEEGVISDRELVDSLITDIHALMGQDLTFDELREALPQILHKYSSFKFSFLLPTINELIASEINKNTLAHHFEVSEIEQLWDKVV